MRRLWIVLAGLAAALFPARAPTPPLPPARPTRVALVAALRRRVRHVFVVYQENRSFDEYFGTFPGVDGLYTAAARAHGFRQWDPLGRQWVTPFPVLAPDTGDPGHSRPALIGKANHGRMDAFIAVEEKAHATHPAVAHDLGLLTMGYEDCRTIPYLWMYAHRFTLFDHFFQGMYGPSTPGNIDLIAAQTGETQWARQPQEAFRSANGRGEPVINDTEPAFGPYERGTPKTTQYDQTYATLMLTLLGRKAVLAKRDNQGVRQDIAALKSDNHAPVPWGWYQEGFGNGTDINAAAYVSHHNSPQYFGYIRQNAPLWSGEHDLLDFFSMLKAGTLPPRSVSIVKGGRHNPFGWKPADRSPYVQSHYLGDDDHAGYSDVQLSEALVAKVVNAVAASPYWNSSVILITWDDEGGFFDHVPPPQFEKCPDGNPCGDGPRIPLLLISPYARSGGVAHAQTDHASFAKFVDVLFQLPPLASLPDEKPWLPRGPHDLNPAIGDLVTGFSAARLEGRAAPLAAASAEIPAADVGTFPPPLSCSDIGVQPVPLPGAAAHPPAGFNPLPGH